jgi:hypothetical protein
MRSLKNHLAQTLRAVAFVTLASTLPAAAETVEVAPGVQVTKRTYTAPVNEQPFFGLAAKSPEQKAEDDKFVSAIIGATGSREKAFEETTKRAWIAIQAGRVREAAIGSIRLSHFARTEHRLSRLRGDSSGALQ